MIRWICSAARQAFPPLPALPLRPLLGVGATVGPVRPAIVCVAVLCAPSATAPPAVAEAATCKSCLHVAPADAWRDARADHLTPVTVPAPGGLLLFGLGVAALLVLRAGRGQ